jgi:pyruvate carboxylase
MTTQEDWGEVADRIGGLALKLKLHCEEASGDVSADAKLAVDAAVDGVAAAFDGLKAVTADPAIKQDVSDVAASLRDAVHNTFAELASELQRTPQG